jgi:hypothetical protein
LSGRDKSLEEDNAMMEQTGVLAIAAIFTGSVLVALFIGETLTTWIIRAMDAGVRRADAAQIAAHPNKIAGKLVVGHRARPQGI